MDEYAPGESRRREFESKFLHQESRRPGQENGRDKSPNDTAISNSTVGCEK